MQKLSELPNIGKILEQQLNEVGISDPQMLVTEGSQKVWMRLKCLDPTSCLNKLYALEGAIEGIRWHNLPESKKRSLKDFYQKQE